MKIILTEKELARITTDAVSKKEIVTILDAADEIEVIGEKAFKQRLLDKISTDPKLLADLTDSVVFGEVFDSVSR